MSRVHRPGSGFTLLFEAYVLSMARNMPVLAMARLVGEHDTRLWRLIDHWVNDAREQHDDSAVTQVGTDHDTASFAVASIRGWWREEGHRLYPKAERLLITADSGGSNGARLRLWKWELQALANELGFPVWVCHFPPGTSKWNKVEHRLFSFISANWRAEPLVDYETIVNLIAHTTTAKGLRVSCRLDTEHYATGRKISDEAMATIRLKPDKFHGDWNYKISPQHVVCS